MKKLVVLVLYMLFRAISPALAADGPLIIDHTCTDLDRIPDAWIEEACGLTLHYAHTSHGSQVTSGIAVLEGLDPRCRVARRASSSAGLPPAETPPALRIYDGNPPETYIQPDDYWDGEAAKDRTRAVAATGHYNFSMWSWCGQVSSASGDYLQRYLATLDQFESEFPGMRFIYMTGHLDGSGSAGTLHRNNETIRAYCREHAKILFDFADIERYDPQGVDYLDQGANDNCAYTGGNWAQEWCAAHPGSDLCASCSCAHSQALNCNLKARAFWHMMTRLAGWNPDANAGFSVSAISGDTAEDGTQATFSVRLTSGPTHGVTLALSSSDTSEGTVSPASLTFTPANWNTPQTVTVTGIDDDQVDSNQSYTIILAPAVSNDPAYNGLDPDDITLSNIDLDATQDSDGDGVPDNVDLYPDDASRASPLSQTGTGRIIVDTSANAGTTLAEVQTLEAGSANPQGRPSGYAFRDGLLAFNLQSVPLAGTVEITLTLPDSIPSGSRCFKVDENGFSEIDCTIQGATTTYAITDGGRGDSDGLADNRISDPIGIAIPGSTSLPLPAGTSGSCFISIH